MNIETEELIKLLEDNDSICVDFEKALTDLYDIDREEVVRYHESSIMVLLGLMKLNNITIEEMLEQMIGGLT